MQKIHWILQSNLIRESVFNWNNHMLNSSSSISTFRDFISLNKSDDSLWFARPIEDDKSFSEKVMSFADFSHLEIIYFFNKVNSKDMVYSGHPRGNPRLSFCWYFRAAEKRQAQLHCLCTVELLEHHGRTIKVKYLDALDGTPILDIKPVFKELQPKGTIRQPEWGWI